MDPYAFYPWYPRGIHVHSFIAAGANHYVALFDDTTVLKFPVAPQKERNIYPADAQRFRSCVRAAAEKGLQVEEQIFKVLGGHPRILQFKGKHEDGLLLEYLPHGSVERFLRTHEHTSTEQRLRWGRQAAEGLAYLHSKNVLHCDVSVGNLLLDQHLSIKLCDFQGRLLHASGDVALDGGVSEGIMSSMPRSDRNHLDRKTDIFALGTALFFVITGQPPFPDLDAVDSEDEVQIRFKRHEFPPLENLPGGDVIRNCWTGKYDEAIETIVDLQRWEALLQPP